MSAINGFTFDRGLNEIAIPNGFAPCVDCLIECHFLRDEKFARE